MKRYDSKLAYEALMNCPLSPDAKIPARIPKNQLDYGDDKTIGCCLKRRNRDVLAKDVGNRFGVYLGKHKIESDGIERFYVGINTFSSRYNFSATESFDDLQEMINEWVLD
jgi:hypothetical protein